jgi:Tol biopolymer transport system component
VRRCFPLAVWALALAGLVWLACRDDVAPFEAADREERSGETVWRLTFSLKDDRSPAWSPNGDSVYYAAEGFGHLPPDPGVLVGLPRDGGVTAPILTNVQLPSQLGLRHWLVAPAPDPSGERLAFMEIAPLREPNPCPGAALSCDPVRDEAPLPPLRQNIVHVRRFDATDALEADTALFVTVPGVTMDSVEVPGIGFVRLYVVRFHPFQRLFDQERGSSFRATWAPDGERLAFSDGLRILIWTLGEDEPVAVPGTEDGVWPAWSPDGEWIAYSRIERADSSNCMCVYLALGPCAYLDYTEFSRGRHLLSLIHPDGSDRAEFGEGDEPAWSPDGRTLFFRRGDQIWRISLDAGQATPVPGTQGGREPAISPDGQLMAFAKQSEGDDYDIWVVSLQQ